MGNPIESPGNARLAAAQPRPKFDPFTGKPIADNVDHYEPYEPPSAEGSNFWAEQRAAAQGSPAYENEPVNPYAPTAWQKRHRVESDIKLPSGQLVRVMRLEREDLLRTTMTGYMDTFTPTLMQETISEGERDRRIKERMNTDPHAVANMFMAIDEVVMTATVRPRITNDPSLVDYGGPNDWRNPKFIAVALIEDITMDDRFAIFAAAFGKSMDELKSLWGEAPGLAAMADVPSVQPDAQ